MRWTLGLLGIVFALHGEKAHAQDTTTSSREMTIIKADLTEEDREIDEGLEEIGVSLGIEGGGNITPGGIHITGNYLYKLVGNEWLDAGVSVVAGGSDAACFRDRQNTKQCDHGYFSGGSTELSLAFRHYFVGPSGFRPFAKLGAGLRVVSLKGDDIRGIGVPVLLGGGIRVRVARRMVAIGQATLRGGVAFWGNDLGTKGQWSLAMTAGVEFNLD